MLQVHAARAAASEKMQQNSGVQGGWYGIPPLHAVLAATSWGSLRCVCCVADFFYLLGWWISYRQWGDPVCGKPDRPEHRSAKEIKMPYSDHSGDLVTNQDARAAFARQAMSRWVDVGERLVLPEVNQQYEVIGHRTWSAQPSEQPDVFLIMASACCVCGKPFSFETYVNFKYLPRTCIAHHHVSMRHAPKQPKPRPSRSPVQDAVLDVIGVYALIHDRVPMADAIQTMIERLPQRNATRDIRRQEVRRAIKRMHDAGVLGCTIDGDQFVF
jgi:hypothetical protein